MSGPCVYNIPSGCSFVDRLAQGLIEKAGSEPLSLARFQILLPTRRACRTLREAFLRIGAGPMLLPRMTPVSDVDEDELFITLAGAERELSLPPAIPPLRRRILLARLIAARGHGRGMEQDLTLASALARLMDQIHTEELSLSDLPSLVDRADFAEHWQVSLDFLSLLSVHWPTILSEQGMMDAAERRTILIRALGDHWRESPPPFPVIAAGSTGSIPATAALLKVVAGLPDGCIVLPGLDPAMDDDSWAAIGPTHPQATLKHLVEDVLGVARTDVAPWPGCDTDSTDARQLQTFCREIMRPAETAQAWRDLANADTFSPDDLQIERYDCANAQEEALLVAGALRRALEEEGRTAALVTPDRTLARRVAMACRRWNIEIDDSGGRPLSETRAGLFLGLILDAAAAEFRPVALLDLLKHALCLPPGYEGHWRADIRRFDRELCRGPAFTGGFSLYRRKLADAKKAETPESFIDRLEDLFAPLSALPADASCDAWCEAHLRVAERLCAADLLWSGQDGEAASILFSTLREQSALLPSLTAADYRGLLRSAMDEVAIRPLYGLHPRLQILGQLEARLVTADTMILSGLNEGTWPSDPAVDPWMSRPMRARFRLPPLERSIGLGAHDFAQALGARRIVLTRALKVDGAPTVPSRWLQRMEAVLKAAGRPADSFGRGVLLAQMRGLDHAEDVNAVQRPAPAPPVAVRPRRLSVTKIATWLGDPYSIYAQAILRLDPLRPHEQTLDAAQRGTLLHAMLEKFCDHTRGGLPDDAEALFVLLAAAQLDEAGLDHGARAYWEPRLAKIARWVAATEREWRQAMRPWRTETKGEMTLPGPAGPFTLSGVADRIDRSPDGASAAIIDYKSGGKFTVKGVRDGRFPQLPLEALMIEQGGFEGESLPVSLIAYWVLSGSRTGGEDTYVSGAQLREAMDNAQDGLQSLIDAFDRKETRYYSLPRPDRAPRFNDYEHLARVREWTALGEPDEEAA